ncbi:MAG TPA: hypothetical protein VH000_11995, partial [Rhizomicrobium sp.]|nr:hypothetical protein [Rhizomicrobium sp.]
MKWLVTAALSAALLTGMAHAADNPVCLRINQIRDTRSPDNRTILFHMTNGTTWKNSLPQDCNGLPFNGFSYTTSLDKICSNLQT